MSPGLIQDSSVTETVKLWLCTAYTAHTAYTANAAHTAARRRRLADRNKFSQLNTYTLPPQNDHTPKDKGISNTKG